MPNQAFIDEAIRKAEAAGYYPADGQQFVNWDDVEEWSHRVQQPGFQWMQDNQHPKIPGYTGHIIVAQNGAICSGQHRILGGLMGGNPVPPEAISSLPVDIPMHPWQ